MPLRDADPPAARDGVPPDGGPSEGTEVAGAFAVVAMAVGVTCHGVSS